MSSKKVFSLILVGGIPLVVIGALNLEEANVIYCITVPCPQEEAPVWPKLMIVSGVALMLVSGYLAVRRTR